MQNPNDIHTGVWLVYDGDCPLCHHAAHALRIQQTYGPLHLINARDSQDHPLMRLINAQKYDLDKGMVIYHGGKIYHGKAALSFMGMTSTSHAWYRHITSLYPLLRATRNTLLHLRGKTMIRNLSINTPIFESIFGNQWAQLPTVMHRHYANRPYSNDAGIVEGTMTIESSPLGRLLTPLFRFLGTLAPYEGTDIPAQVIFASDPKSNHFHFNRTFFFPGKIPYRFHSTMKPLGQNEMAEVMRFGLCWRTAFFWTGQKVMLEHRGYGLYLCGLYIPLPLGLLLGKGYAEETPLDDNHFSMAMHITHPLWGKVFSYHGTFKMTKDVT
jgi:predicted DCC family thiol-disulfide oxidoreductase YuxK